MISTLTGTVRHVGLDRLVVEVGGVGLTVHTTPSTAAAAHRGHETQLSTSLVVREDSLTLFGFAGADERDLFEIVQTVSGVGPRLALAMLAVLDPATLRLAVASGDVRTLTKVPGIGKKGAERLVLELRDKIAEPEAVGASGAAAPAPEPESVRREPVREALVGLGWSAKQAESAIEAVVAREGEDQSVPALLKAALRELGR
ncbi:Holliday junction branch migration protein RuvA [Mobilicoccus pelagius]|uniref:Holliday junction branch migration complex subunit RuvA n=1 Tax=Mobilicoccus pelagius NBRC 104925 TaxID=1089455 RepID=H5UPF8_9MICO|nr:Holliday junction branch migration protein RuvA [Mobilicoccus pelagius]GAB47616.1 Holliday junction ATP-dependent DNA helicase RuvA [Mobilicoccus pelagius NBRC 104925]